MTDHHSEYLASAVAALTPEGHRRVDELLEQLAQAGVDHEWLVQFAKARRVEADRGSLEPPAGSEPARMLTKPELEGLEAGFMAIRDQEHLEDVANWANAVLALLKDEGAHPSGV